MNHLGIITALLSEARCFHKHPQLNEPLKISDNISLIVSGIGQHAAHTAANKLVHAGADALLCTGFAGALSDHLEAGDLILPATVNTETGKKLRCDPVWHATVLSRMIDQRLDPQSGDMFSTERMLASADEKIAAAKNGAIAVDMESAAVINVASEHQIPALVIRVVIDPKDFSIPDYIINDQYGEIGTVSLVRSILLRPARLITLIKLGRFYRAATNNLRRVGKNLDLVMM